MTRCLNCGADRESDICDVCGLGAAAAELALRRRLLNRTAVFLLGAIAFVSLSGRYPPLDLDGILIFVGLLFFVTLAIGMVVERRALRHSEVEGIKRLYYALIPVPWLLTFILVGNGLLDRAPAEIHNARVISRFSMSGPLPSRRLVVQSWRSDHRFERVPATRFDLDRFHAGDDIVIHVKGGLIGIPWVEEISRP
jgi:Ca2+/Na+ antiporter